jgi:6-phosphofructokinase 1
MTALKRKALITQTGGPTPVANQTFAGIVETCFANGIQPYVADGGWVGLAKANFIPVTLTGLRLEKVAQRPGFYLPASKDVKVLSEAKYREATALGKGDKTVSAEVIARNLAGFDFVFVNGGNSSAGVLITIREAAQRLGMQTVFRHAMKTIDNDLLVTDGTPNRNLNDHTPGFGSAAKGIIENTYAFDFDCGTSGTVFVSIAMGRDSGWLAASAALARESTEDGPHLIYLPERRFSLEQFRDDVASVVARQHYAHIIVSEGVWTDEVEGKRVRLVDTAVNAFGLTGKAQQDVRMGVINASACAPLLQAFLALQLQKIHPEVRTATLGYYVRSYPFPSSVDSEEARQIGRISVKEAMEHGSGTLAMQRDRLGDITYVNFPLEYVSLDWISTVPNLFINHAGNNVNSGLLQYLKPIVGPLRHSPYSPGLVSQGLPSSMHQPVDMTNPFLRPFDLGTHMERVSRFVRSMVD